MSNWVAETPVVGRRYCPGCEPEADEWSEVLRVDWCGVHRPDVAGTEDGRFCGPFLASGSLESGGEENRRWCDLLREGAS